MAKYKRILLKLSGEALAGPNKTGFDEATCIGVAKQVKQLVMQVLRLVSSQAEETSGEDVQVKILTGRKQTR